MPRDPRGDHAHEGLKGGALELELDSIASLSPKSELNIILLHYSQPLMMLKVGLIQDMFTSPYTQYVLIAVLKRIFLRQNLRPTIRPNIRPNLRWPQNPNIRL